MSDENVQKVELLELANKMNYAIKKYGITAILKSIRNLDPDVHCDTGVNKIINLTCSTFNVSRADLFSEKRGIYNDARKSCYYLLFKYGCISQKVISDMFSRDGASVSNAIKEITAIVVSGDGNLSLLGKSKHDKEIVLNIRTIKNEL
jgi:chromosomal replication initiation ATPase DnaA